MKITLSKITTCVALEQKLGLSRGDIQQIITSQDGTVQVEFKKEPTAEQKSKLESALNMKISSMEA